MTFPTRGLSVTGSTVATLPGFIVAQPAPVMTAAAPEEHSGNQSATDRSFRFHQSSVSSDELCNVIIVTLLPNFKAHANHPLLAVSD